MRYSVAVGALLAAPSVRASVIYSGPLNATPSGGSLPVSFDPLVGGATDFTITISGSVVSVSPGVDNDAFDIGPLAFGTPITLADTTAGATVLSDWGTKTGPWLNTGNTAYFGVSFTVSSQQYLGWAELLIQSSASPSVTLLGYAYNDQPGVSINAGDTPEPSSLSLFAMGAAGLLALRRRRQARN